MTLAKQTRLNEDAQLYQPRDTRTEKEKFKSMNFKEKLQYFNQYYRNKTIAILVCIGFFGYLLYSMFGPKVETVLYTAVVDACIDTETVSSFQSDMIERLGLDTTKSTVIFDDGFFLTNASEYSASNQTRLVTYVMSGDIDIIIAPEEIFSQYASAGYFIKLSECLPPQMFSTLTDHFFYYTTETDTQEASYGIYLDDYAIKDENGDVTLRPVLGILTNARHTENAVSFIESLNLDQICSYKQTEGLQ